MSSSQLHGFGALNAAVSLCYPFWLPKAIARPKAGQLCSSSAQSQRAHKAPHTSHSQCLLIHSASHAADTRLTASHLPNLQAASFDKP